MKDFNYLYAMTQFIFQRDDAISCMVNGLQEDTFGPLHLVLVQEKRHGV